MVKNPPANAGDVGSIPGSGRSPEGGSGNPLQYSCLGNSVDRGAWRVTVNGVTESDIGHDLVTEHTLAGAKADTSVLYLQAPISDWVEHTGGRD